MAKFTPGVGFGQASGSVAGTTYSHNRFGAYIRNRAIPVNPNTSSQGDVRTRFSTVASAWRSLTGSQQNAWKSAAEGVTFFDSLGQSYSPSGFGLYTSINNYRLQLGAALVSIPPPNDTPAALVTLAGTFDISSPELSVAFTNPIPTGAFMLLDMTSYKSNGVNYFGVKDYRRIAILDDTDTTPYSALSSWPAVWGSLPTTAGGRIGVRARVISATGWPSAPQFAVITAVP